MGRPVGGSGALTDALAAALKAAGGEVRTGARVAAITCRDGRPGGAGPGGGGGPRSESRADGVRLEDGTHISARAVVSAADPRTTLTTLLEDPPPGAAKLVARWRSRPQPQGYESKLDAVVANLPRPRGIDADHLAKLGVADPLHATLVVAPGLDKIATAHAAAELGSVASDPLFLANVPSVLDPTVAPPDGHLFSLEVLFTPYKLAGGWSTTDEPERWLRSFATLLEPGFLDAIKRWRLVGPGDYERDFALPKGHPAAFQSGPLAALAGRGRNRELMRYETALPGLYLTGSGTFPGAGISGAPRGATPRMSSRHSRAGCSSPTSRFRLPRHSIRCLVSSV